KAGELGLVDPADEGDTVVQRQFVDERFGGAARLGFADDRQFDVPFGGEFGDGPQQDGDAFEWTVGAGHAVDLVGDAGDVGAPVDGTGVKSERVHVEHRGADPEFAGHVVRRGLGGHEDVPQPPGDPALHGDEAVPAAFVPALPAG